MPGQYQLALLFESGMGAARSPREAVKWFARAHAGGDGAVKRDAARGLARQPRAAQADLAHQWLQDLGYAVGVNGGDDQTRASIIAFQNARQLEADGQVGVEMLSALARAKGGR